MVQIFKKEKAFSLRSSGKSYGEILKELNIKSKGTLSYWFKDLKLSADAEKRLESKILIARKRGLFAFNEKRTKRILKENRKVFREAAESINHLSKREILLIGIALYWGEGTKSERRSNKSVVFSNSDPKMIALFMRFLREILKVPEEWIGGGINIYPQINEKIARNFWSGITKIPPKRFYVTKQISRASRGIRPSNTLPYGTVAVRVNKRLLFWKIKGYIDGLGKQV